VCGRTNCCCCCCLRGVDWSRALEPGAVPKKLAPPPRPLRSVLRDMPPPLLLLWLVRGGFLLLLLLLGRLHQARTARAQNGHTM
jgi:hypothetical protein